MNQQEMELIERGIAPPLYEVPQRRARWAHLLGEDKLRASMKGISRLDEDSLNQKRWIMECLLDNQLRCVDQGDRGSVMAPEAAIGPLHESLLHEDSTMSSMGWATAGTAPSNAKVFTTQSLGMIRRVFPKLISSDLVSIQPLSQPTGKIFFIDFKFSHAASSGSLDAIAAGDNVYDNTLWDVGVMKDYSSFLADNASHASATSATAEAGGSGDAEAREMHLDISSVDIVCESKKLAADWTVEIEQDLRAYHGLNADEELMSATAAEITREIDQTMIQLLDTAAAGQTVTWQYNGYGGTLPSEQKAYAETLYDAIEDAAALIWKKRYRRPAWVVTNVAGAVRLRKLNGFRAAGDGQNADSLSVGMGARRIFGTIQEQYVVYVDPWYRAADALPTYIVGYKGDSFMETGVVYAPYVPFMRTAPWTNPKTFKISRGLMSRFAKKRVIDDLYAKVTVVGT